MLPWCPVRAIRCTCYVNARLRWLDWTERERLEERRETIEWGKARDYVTWASGSCLDESSSDSQTESFSKFARAKHAILLSFNHTPDSSDDSRTVGDYPLDYLICDLMSLSGALVTQCHIPASWDQMNVTCQGWKDEREKEEEKKEEKKKSSHSNDHNSGRALLIPQLRKQVCATGVHRVRWLLSALTCMR